MQLTGLTTLFRQHTSYRTALTALSADASSSTSHMMNMIRSARPYALATLAKDWQGAILYITAQGRRVHNVAEQLPIWVGDERRILRYAEPTPMFYDRLAWDKAVIQDRLEVLSELMRDDNRDTPIIVTSARALSQRTMPPRLFHQHTQQLKVGQQITPDALVKSWVQIGYEPTTMVAENGTFSRRGGIIDIFPMSSTHPIRIEFFGDEIDTLRTFDISTQRTIETIQQVPITPAREALPYLTSEQANHIQAWLSDKDDSAENDRLSTDMSALQEGVAFPFLEHYLPYLYENPFSILDYLTDDVLIVVEDFDDIEETIQTLIDDAITNRDNLIATGQLSENHPIPYVAWDILQGDLDSKRIVQFANVSEDNSTRAFRPSERYGAQLRPMLRAIRSMMNDGKRIIVVTEQTDRLREIWQDQDQSDFIPHVETIDKLPESGSIVMIKGSINQGWVLQEDGDSQLILLSDSEIFNWSRPEPRRRKQKTNKKRRLPEADYGDWETGHYVVHVDYGIGRYVGMQTRTVEGTEREYLIVEYDGTDRLFVPIHQSDRLTRYVGADERPPKMSKLGKPIEWVKAREKARKAAEDEARELLDIYAKRANANGFMYQPDTPWQRELEASFPYVETDDQLRVLREVKQDMEQSTPMDRLVCGDVGYGKTEVALRAAFKAVMDGKQVAVLVPTTVLADQHYRTFSHRMAPFPVKIELLSRFRTKAQQAKAVQKLSTDEIDIIIGTHRILSQDVELKNLGLIIIDEEQRFGVKHKEHFKKLRSNVDILTLTATPIPRTLYMSLSGVRDISMIQTPPEERLPVVTHVGSFDNRMIRQAILRELDRGGQVFVIHNRVRTIENIRERLEGLIPEASITVAHGQMSGRELEGVITDFGKGEYDILLATSIIENGIDMPNVNTLIVDRADWFGLSQLYQIRGRVGRGAQQAYAYFFHPGGSRLTEEAKQRLDTLAEYTDLGVGFQIAVRDLELRGGGDILSTKQSGHVVAVGLQLYTQLLQQSVSKLKGEEIPEGLGSVSHERVIIDLPIPAYIPSDWIPEMALRLQMYRRVANLETPEAIDKMSDEMRDRFGELPRAIEGLFYQMRVKLLATAIRAKSVIKPRQHILIKLPWLMAIDREALAYTLGDDIEVSRTAVELAYDASNDFWQARLLSVLEILLEGLPEQLTEEGEDT